MFKKGLGDLNNIAVTNIEVANGVIKRFTNTPVVAVVRKKDMNQVEADFKFASSDLMDTSKRYRLTEVLRGSAGVIVVDNNYVLSVLTDLVSVGNLKKVIIDNNISNYKYVVKKVDDNYILETKRGKELERWTEC